MKVLFVTEDLANGGSERVISVLANGFASKCDSAVVAIRRDIVKYSLDDKVIYYPFKDDNKGKVSRTLGRVRHLYKAINTFKPDVVVAFDVVPIVYSYIVCKLSKVKLVVSERADPKKHEEKGRIGKLYFHAFKKANGAVFQTADAQSYYSVGIQRKSIIIPNPINEEFVIERFKGVRSKEIVTACRLTKQKNLKLFIDIVLDINKKFPEYKGIIYGEGPEYESLYNYSLGLGGNEIIIFPGRVNNIRDKIFTSQFYLCTSDYEGISNSMLEAMTLGLNVICTDCPVGGARMAIQSGKNGVLFPIGDKEAGVQAICDLITNESKSCLMGEAATDIRNRWSSNIIVDQWIKYIQTIAS